MGRATGLDTTSWKSVTRCFVDWIWNTITDYHSKEMKRTEIVNRIREQARTFMPESQTILYGSEARGDASQDSDIDLLILVPEDKVLPEKEHFIARKLFEIELQSGVVISSVIMPRKQWENPPVVTPFYQNVKREGVVL